MYYDVVSIVFIFVLISVLFLILFWWFVDRPTRELIRIIESAPSKDFLIRAPIRKGIMMSRLSQSFNRLLEQITLLDAFKLESERRLIVAEQKLKYKEELEQKSRIIENTNSQLEARLKELSVLYDFSQEVSASLELDELTHVVERFIGEHLGFQEFAFLVYEEESQSLVVKATYGFPEEAHVHGMSFREGEGVTGQVLLKKEVIYIPDTRCEPDYRYYKGENKENGSFLSIPLIFRKNIVGVLNMFRKEQDSFSPQEIQFLSTLGVELAIALVNAKLYSRTRELSVRDELTQLYNRRHFQSVLPLEIKRAHRFKKNLTLIMMDIDFFKKINDQYGHLTGDAVLKEVVFLIGAKIREVDFFARFGGEEFVLILPNTPKEDGLNVAEKIRQLVEKNPFLVTKERQEHLTISMGVASYPQDGQTMEDLLDAADTALYAAKHQGRNCVIGFKPSGTQSLSSNLPNKVSSCWDSSAKKPDDKWA